MKLNTSTSLRILFAALLASACSAGANLSGVGKKLRGDKKTEPAAESGATEEASGSEPAPADESENGKALAPQMVSGSFLSCIRLPPETSGALEAETAFACRVMQKNGEILDAKDPLLSITWSVLDAANAPLAQRAGLNPEGAWHFVTVLATALVPDGRIVCDLRYGEVAVSLAYELEAATAEPVAQVPPSPTIVVGLHLRDPGDNKRIAGVFDGRLDLKFNPKTGSFALAPTPGTDLSTVLLDLPLVVQFENGSSADIRLRYYPQGKIAENLQLPGDWSRVKGMAVDKAALNLKFIGRGNKVKPLRADSPSLPAVITDLPDVLHLRFDDQGPSDWAYFHLDFPLVVQ